MPENNSQKNNLAALAYKLLNDALLVLIIFYLAVLIAENVIPGIISSHIGLTKITLPILIVIAAISYLGKKYNFTFRENEMKKSKLLLALTILFLLLISLSLFKFSMIAIAVIVPATFLIFLYFYKLIFSSDSQ
ncbi:MAG: hypothetical protein NT136_03070 [Candidatus Moranbacteria bacterium]|nr:hypothetical protein [Candidatus Moranbacteria bacterium]